MTRIIEDQLVDVVAGALVGVIDVDDGPTDEQRSVLQAIVTGYWGRSDLDVAAMKPVSPAEAAAVVKDSRAQRRFRELMVLLELCRHPISDAQVERVDEYAAALGESGPEMQMVRDLVRESAAVASADCGRFAESEAENLAERSLRAQYPLGDFAAPDHELAARLQAFHELPEGTLGYEYVEFYRRNGLTLPGDDVHIPLTFVSHDMCHVIAGYEPVGVDEIALGGMQLAMVDTDVHWLQLLGNLGVHEAGFLGALDLKPRVGTLARAGAAETLGHAMARGSECTGDFTAVDHLAMADRPLADVRAEFGVPPRQR
ncbi:MAG: hypothetical protein M3046_13695 [Actinomycetota bacterium]|nr:hypothetical protein [Actinomycetota bacterium]